MNYPVWQLDFFGGGLLIAIIAIFHVYISHFAVGGGLFLVLTEIKAQREGNAGLMDYVSKHARFFLLVTMVAGGITGVGIWFTIALLNPGATSLLIHTFVFAWAIEWVFFVIEIVALFIYCYTFNRMESKQHQLIGWIYFGAAWMSLFIINGIIDFMLTPGNWLQNGSFWSGFFNPTFWPALAFRTFFALIIAGLFGLTTATWIKDDSLRTSIIRYSALWLLTPFLLFIGSAYWYRAALPPELQTMIFESMPEMQPFITGFTLFSPLLILGGLLMSIRMPAVMGKTLTCLMLVTGLLYMGCFEFIREGGRRPYIIRDHMYSTAILKEDMTAVQQQGLLRTAKWVKNRTITDENRLEAGRELFNLLCLSCHALDGPLNEIRKATANFSPAGLDAMISGMDTVHPYMPPFAGTDEERYALALYLAYGLNGKKDQVASVQLKEKATEIPPFDPDTDEYLLLAWPVSGINSMSDASSFWNIQPPGLDIRAQLILRGELPEVVNEGVTISYRVENGFAEPASRVPFWDFASTLFDNPVERDVGLSGSSLSGTMEADEGYFYVQQLPLVPYPEEGGYDPYPLISIEARDSEGKLLASTALAAPVDTEMGCKTCHGGNWRVDDRAGLSAATAANILDIHDRLSGTELLAEARADSPRRCQACHRDGDGGGEDDSTLLNLSASLHGFHAVFLKNRGADACAFCHPSSSLGATRCLRGIHDQAGLDCTSCHGALEDHALSLLKGEERKPRAQQLAVSLTPQVVDSPEDVTPRSPWVNQPDCLDCHQDFQPPETESTFNSWSESAEELYRNRRDESGLLFCSACHGSGHAVFPAENPYGPELDVIQPMQYQKEPLPIGSNLNCAVCHTVEMEEEMHHPNMLRDFRNQ